MRPTFTVIACHFGDPFWISEMARRVDQLSSTERVPDLFVVDQDRPSKRADELATLPRVAAVLSYPVDVVQASHLGHDHPAALNQAVRETVRTTHVLILDSDTMLRSGWLAALDAELERADCVIAGDRRWGLSHPCFMAIPVEALGAVDFTAGTVPLGIDTGRLVAYQLDAAGLRVSLLRPSPSFGGLRGDDYLSSTVTHVGSASFASSTDSRLLRQVDRRTDTLVRKLIREDRFDMPPTHVLALRARAVFDR